MAFQTSVLREGGWVTQTVSLDAAVVKANSPPTAKSTYERAEFPPDYGVLTRTVIESPVARWLLSARLRSAQHMDVAFIGDRYVQISELGHDGRLRDVVRHAHFPSNIINAQVIGSPPEDTHNRTQGQAHPNVKVEEDAMVDGGNRFASGGDLLMDAGPDLSRSAPSAVRSLPPQQLIVVLESGDCVLLFLRRKQASDGYEFVMATRGTSHRHDLTYPGYHASVDPSSRYLALACQDSLFVVYELASRHDLAQAYARGEPLRPFKSFRPRAVQGDILHMTFLYPNPHDDYHIILLLIVRRHGDSRMITYDWEAGDDLKTALTEEKRGQPLPPQYQMPILVIPLTVHSAFFAISHHQVGICKNILDAPAEFEDIRMEGHPPPSLSQDTSAPLWTAWTRPYRLPTYSTERDNIYLARDDGVVTFLDIDSDNILGASVEIGRFECDIGLSFCSLFDEFNDILILGCHSSPGIVSQVRPRQPNVELDTIPNWAPVADIATTDPFADSNGIVGANGQTMVPWAARTANTYASPDRIFVTSGRDQAGAITEFRHGLRAYIGLDIDPETPVKQTWIFPAPSGDASSAGFHMLISLVDKSVALHLSADMAQASQLDENTTPYDLTSRTVAAVQLPGGTVVQVTETCLVLVHSNQSTVRYRHDETFQKQQVLAVDACVLGDLVAVSATIGSQFQICLLQVISSGGIRVVQSFLPGFDVTCLCLAMGSGSPRIIVGVVNKGNPWIHVFNVRGGIDSLVDLNHSVSTSTTSSINVQLEALSSVALIPLEGYRTAVVCGTRGGDVVTLVLDISGSPITVISEKVGITAAHISLVANADLGPSILVVCGGRVSLQAHLDAQTAQFRFMHMVWAVDAGDDTKLSPFVSAASVLEGGLPGCLGKTQLVLSSGSRIMLAELDTRPGPAHRTLPVAGTPTKVLYSHVLGCLVVAIRDDQDRATIQFVDPDTGDDLSFASDKTNEEVQFVSGLGKADDRILGLNEWTYKRNSDKWVFLLVATKGGRLLVLSTSPVVGGTAARAAQKAPRRNKIKYWTRLKRPRFQEPVYSVVGWNDNIFYCAGETIYWDQLDLIEKRLRTVGTFELGSHATSLRIISGKLVALTERDSVEVIDIGSGAPGSMTLVHADSHWRRAAHMIEVATGVVGDDLHASILLVSNLNDSAVGLWVPWAQPGRDCRTVFKADLPVTVRKLVRGRTRPSWQQARRKIQYGVVPSTADGAEILGICVDGSVQHFTILEASMFMVLHLVEKLAISADPVWNGASPAESDSDSSDDELEESAPNGMLQGRQVDGNVLQQCLEGRTLESLFAKPTRAARLFQLLDNVNRGQLTVGLNDGNGSGEGERAEGGEERAEERKARYIALLYDILEYHMAPVL